MQTMGQNHEDEREKAEICQIHGELNLRQKGYILALVVNQAMEREREELGRTR